MIQFTEIKHLDYVYYYDLGFVPLKTFDINHNNIIYEVLFFIKIEGVIYIKSPSSSIWSKYYFDENRRIRNKYTGGEYIHLSKIMELAPKELKKEIIYNLDLFEETDLQSTIKYLGLR